MNDTQTLLVSPEVTPEPESPEETFPSPVQGQVIDLETGEPVAEMRLSVEEIDVEVTTDSAGGFAFEMAEEIPTLTLTWDDPAWQTAEGAQERVFAVMEGEPLLLELQRVSAPELELWALDPEGHPLPGATLLAVGANPIDSVGLGTTGAGGYLSVARPPAESLVQVIGSHADWPLLLSPPVGPDDHAVRVTALEVIDVTVTVLDPDGLAVVGAVVAHASLPLIAGAPQDLLSLDLGIERRDTEVTDTLGRVEIDRLPRCPLRIIATPPVGSPLAPGTLTVDLASLPSPASVTLTLLSTLDQVSASGTVLDLMGTPVAGALVSWADDSGAMGSTVTGASGQFEIAGPETLGALTLRVEADGYQTIEAVRVLADQPGIEIVLLPLVTIRGHVGRVHPVALSLWTPAMQHWSAGWVMSEAQWTDGQPSGQFEWSLERLPETLFPGPAWLMVLTREGEIAVADITLTTAPAQVHDVGALTLSPALTLPARVIGSGGQPIDGATVLWESQQTTLSDIDEITAWFVETDAEGQFTLRGLPEGHWHLGITGPAQEPAAFEVDVPGDEGRTFILDEENVTHVTIRVLDAEGLPLEGARTLVDDDFSDRVTEITTDAAGEAHHLGVTPGPHHLELAVTEGDERSVIREGVEVLEGGFTWSHDLSQWHTLTGIVTRGDARAGGIDLRLDSEDSRDFATDTTDEQGAYRLCLPGGSYRLWAGGAVHDVELMSDQWLDITLEP
ncbi:carboxypeptidase regulatory-like domain-containing protein [Candidatus Sumerlaeota bacterium]|nr:carboxypeptidase regulatory-like domain-containing protein [Candidatus Sumerlaeota bacterium]